MKLPGNPFSSLPNTPQDPDVPQDVPRQEERLRATLVTTYAAPEASSGLHRRIADMAALRDQQMVMSPAHHWRPLKITLACSVFVLLIGAYFIGPHVYAALTLRRIQKAMLNTRTAHITSWICKTNETRFFKKSEIWNEGDKWRIEQDEGRWLETRGVNGMPLKRGNGDYEEQYNPQTPLLAFRPPGLPQRKGLSLLDSMEDVTGQGLRSRVECLGKGAYVEWMGNHVARDTKVDLYSWQTAETAKDRLVFSVNPKTNLPILARVQHQDEYDVWTTTAEIDYEFDKPMPPHAFDYPPRPEEEILQEAHLSRAEWWTKLNTPLMQSNVGGHNIAIRDFRVNAVGDVFMLYTIAKGGGFYTDEAQTLTDDKGNVYLRAVHLFPFRPTIWDEKGKTQGFVFENGKELKAAWWVPLRPQNGKAWNPRRYTMTFQTRESFRLNGNSATGPVKFSLPVYQKNTGIVPPYMPYMTMKLDQCAIPVADAHERVIYYQETKRDMNQALQWMNVEQQKLEEWERLAHQTLNIACVYLDQSRVFSALGRHEEARAALRKARSHAFFYKTSFTTRGWDEEFKELKKAMKKEGVK